MLELRRKIIGSLDELSDVCSALRNSSKVIVLTSGCFDILHGGHLEYLCDAAGWGELIVGINSDKFVKKLKGDDRPARPEEDRAFTMAGFYPVKYVTIFDCDYELILAVKPDIYVVSSTSHVKIQSDQARVTLLENFGTQIMELQSNKKDSTTAIIERMGKAAA